MPQASVDLPASFGAPWRIVNRRRPTIPCQTHMTSGAMVASLSAVTNGRSGASANAPSALSPAYRPSGSDCTAGHLTAVAAVAAGGPDERAPESQRIAFTRPTPRAL